MRELSSDELKRLDELHLEVRREKFFNRQVALVDQIAEIIGYPKLNPRGKWAKQLVWFICQGTDEESTWAGSLQQKREPEAHASSKCPEAMVMGEAFLQRESSGATSGPKGAREANPALEEDPKVCAGRKKGAHPSTQYSIYP